MKKLIFLFVTSCLVGCSEESGSKPDVDSARSADSIAAVHSNGTNANDSAAQLVVIDSVARRSDTAAQPDNKFRAAFRFYYTTSYCGGAPPTEEIIQQNEILRLLTNSTLKFKNHHTGFVYTIRTSPDAEGTIELEEGKYDVYLTRDINPGLPTGFDPKCSQWLDKLMFTVKAVNDGKMRDIIIHFECNPCDLGMKMRP